MVGISLVTIHASELLVLKVFYLNRWNKWFQIKVRQEIILFYI